LRIRFAAGSESRERAVRLEQAQGRSFDSEQIARARHHALADHRQIMGFGKRSSEPRQVLGLAPPALGFAARGEKSPPIGAKAREK
jgi:hypothetical protein